MAAQEQASKVNLYAEIGPDTSQQAVSKVVVNAMIGPPDSQLSVSKVVMYALLDVAPIVRHRSRVMTGLIPATVGF
jgi:hypothetical protein